MTFATATPLVPALSSPLPLATVLAAATALALWLEHRFGWGRKIGATLLVILFGALLSNLDLVPAGSPVYDAIGGPVTSLAIVWLLLAVRLSDLKAAGPKMLGGFAIACAATFVAAVAGTWLLAPTLDAAVRPDAWKLAGVLTGTYTGGSLNFASVGRALELPDSLFAATAAADNVMTAVWMGATLMLPVWLRRFYPPPPSAEDERRGGAAGGAAGDGGQDGVSTSATPSPLSLTAVLRPLDVSALLALGLALLWLSEAIAGVVPGVPSVVWLTTLALAAAQIPAVRRLEGALPLGVLALTLFFVTIGIGSRLAEIARVGIEVFWLTLLVVAVHGLLTFGFARLAKIDAETTAVASQAAVGGPSTALALAMARGQHRLALPGMLVGLSGYAAGTYTGLAAAYLMRGWLG